MRLTDTQGRSILIEKSFLETGMFADGSDLSASLDGTNTFSFATKSGSNPVTYTLTRSIFCVNLTVGGGGVSVILNTGGFKIFCTGTLTNNANGTITNAGLGGGNASAGSGGAAIAGVAASEVGGAVAGGAGGTGTPRGGGPRL